MLAQHLQLRKRNVSLHRNYKSAVVQNVFIIIFTKTLDNSKLVLIFASLLKERAFLT